LKWSKNPPTRQVKIRQLAKQKSANSPSINPTTRQIVAKKKLVEQKDIHIFAASNTQNENL
jgi:hypothetical protein